MHVIYNHYRKGAGRSRCAEELDDLHLEELGEEGGWRAGQDRHDQTPTKGGGAPGGPALSCWAPAASRPARWDPPDPPPGTPSTSLPGAQML